MKQFKFQNKASVIRGIKEEKPRKKRNWDRILYLTIFALIFASFLFYILQRNIYVSSLGEVITERFDVMNAEDIQILKYYVVEQDTVKAGDTLFKYRSDFREEDDGGGLAGVTISNTLVDKPSDWIMREITNTKKNIQLKSLDIKELESRLVKANSELERLKLEVYLDVHSPAVLKQIRQNISDHLIDKSKLQSEISYLYQYLRQLEAIDIQDRARSQAAADVANAGFGSGSTSIRYYLSPVSGIITQVLTPEFGITYRKDVTMYISDLDKIFIKAYIEQNDIDFYQPGDVVKLNFIDGTKSQGKIKDFYINTQEVPIEFREVRGKNQRNIVTEIYPLSTNDQLKWMRYYKFTVKVSKLKYF
ncbi:MAG: hypothetical protein Q7J34_07330 [Bacteroidales bacterium]|jgi:multidrug resistance efflux pump|nr:hypothetical protein [Bacteroidales bacterium]